MPVMDSLSNHCSLQYNIPPKSSTWVHFPCPVQLEKTTAINNGMSCYQNIVIGQAVLGYRGK